MTRSRGRQLSLALCLGAAAFLLTSSAAADGRYTDETGDGGEAPDITEVSVTSDATGQIQFKVGVVDLPSPADVRTFLLLDTDLNPETGAPDSLGADYLFVADESDDTYWFGRWDGTDFADTPYSTVSVYSDRTGATFSVNRSELGDTAGFNFWVRTRTGDVEADQADTAPELGNWNYTLAVAGPDIQGVIVSSKPALGPKAGKPFTVTPIGLRVPAEGGPLAPSPDSYTCTAKLAGKSFAGTGKGRCTWKLPKAAKRKRLVVSVTVGYQGATRTFVFPYRVT